MNIVKERAHRILTTEPGYRAEEVKYARSVLKSIDQEDLIKFLGSLNYPELKAIVSCGVPGHAQSHALLMLKDKRDKLDAYVTTGGLESKMETYVEDPEEENNGITEGIQSSQKGREGNRRKVGKTSSDSRTS